MVSPQHNMLYVICRPYFHIAYVGITIMALACRVPKHISMPDCSDLHNKMYTTDLRDLAL